MERPRSHPSICLSVASRWLCVCAFNPHHTFSSRVELNPEYMYELFHPPLSIFHSSLRLSDPIPLTSCSTFSVSGERSHSLVKLNMSVGSRGFTAGRRAASRHYTTSPLYCSTEIHIFSRARQTRRKLQRCQISHKLPDLPRHGNKRKFQQWLFMGFVRVRYSGRGAGAEVCVEP